MLKNKGFLMRYLNSYTLYYKISELQFINLDFEYKKRSSTVVIKKASFM